MNTIATLALAASATAVRISADAAAFTPVPCIAVPTEE
jgi:hypothetical protein